jgi:hypothetical protein
MKMLKSIRSSLAIALMASAAFGGAALASGDYYDGASAEPAATVDLFQTSSIGTDAKADRATGMTVISDRTVDNGDYYQGANRPL